MFYTFLLSALLFGSPLSEGPLNETTFELTTSGEVIATIAASCRRCSWDVRGRESAVLSLTIDGRYSQHLFLVHGGSVAPYKVGLGHLSSGTHRLRVRLDPTLSAPEIGETTVISVDVATVTQGDPDFTALARAPVIYARPDTVGGFSDVPLVMWYETYPTPRGVELRYSVIFSNEDGGTPTDRLMATWGRATDIEFIYGVELDREGRVLSERFQGPKHQILPFAGTRDGTHPRLWVVTDNNMVSESGNSSVRYAPAPLAFQIAQVSREVVMDAHPWTYRVMARELAREGRIADSAAPGSGKIPDPRRFAYVEACGELQDVTLSFAVATASSPSAGRASPAWHESDGGLAQFRIARSGCFRGAVAVPRDSTSRDLRALRFRVFTRPPREGESPLPPGTGQARLTRVNRVFLLGEDYTPGSDLFVWSGDATLTPAGADLVLEFAR